MNSNFLKKRLTKRRMSDTAATEITASPPNGWTHRINGLYYDRRCSSPGSSPVANGTHNGSIPFANGSLTNGCTRLLPPRTSPSKYVPVALFSNGSFNYNYHDVVSKELVYSEFMKAHKCYDLIPTSTKMVVFDTNLAVKKAFFALVYNGVRAAPLWDSSKQEFSGMLTITDFINILRKYYISSTGISQELEEHKISTWKDELAKDFPDHKQFVFIQPNDSLFSAVKTLCESKVHRLPIVDPISGNVLYVLTHKRILRFLYLYIFDLPKPPYMSQTPKELGIGTWNNVQSVNRSAPLIEALNKFCENRVSALPVLNDDGEVVDVYAKFDVINLAAEKSYNNLNMTVEEALKHRIDWFEGVNCCQESDTLASVIENIVKAEVHRLVVVDANKHPIGIFSLSDLLSFLIMKPVYEQSAKMDVG